MWRYLAAALMVVSVRTEAQDAGPDWQWDQDSKGCAVIQRVGSSKDILEIDRYPASNEIWVTLADSRIKTFGYQNLSKITLTLDPGGTSIANGRLRKETDRMAAAVAIGLSDPAFLQAFANTSTVIVSHEKVGSLRRPVRAPADAVRELLQCEDGKLRDWGIDPLYWHSLRERPRPLTPLGQLFSPDDYPPGYLLNGVEGGLVLRLAIGTDGKVKGCIPVNRRPDRYFLQNVCGKLKLVARFHPAVDQHGQMVPAPFITAAGFEIER